MLELKNLAVGYGKKPVLEGVSTIFQKATLTSIVGVNGCGKSTLLKTLMGILPPMGGEATLDGKHLFDMKRGELAKRLSYLAQGKNTPDMTVETLVLHGRFPYLGYPRKYSAQDREIALTAMHKMGLEGQAEAPLSALSGGMRQKAYIAMALAQDTDVLLLDEPSTYLDISHQLELMQILRALADGGKTVIAVMHDLPMAFSFSDSIALLDGGRLALHDTPQAVAASKLLKNAFGIGLSYNPQTGDYYYKRIEK